MSNLTKKERNYHVIGLMSGTSLDGLDIAYCSFSINQGHWKFEIENAKTIPYPKNLSNLLAKSLQLSAEEIFGLDIKLGNWQGKQVLSFANENKLDVDYICSHGHTIYHQPSNGFTVQIGNSYSILRETGIPVISDFRSKDVSLGGNGAPLVPIGDQLLFEQYDYCLNLGGIANISYSQQNKRLAYDISPCNIALNYLAQLKGLKFDESGKIAKSGNFNNDLFNRLNEWSYYEIDGPKSLGFEEVRDAFLPILKVDISAEDILCTVTHHIAYQIIKSIKRTNADLLITGGGAYNHFLIQSIEKYKPDLNVIIPDKKLIEFKEALIFAFLGVLRTRGEVNCLSSVTGASADSCGGVIYE